ncbi:MAG: hypothetical protein JWQ09_3095 [Segetibacter sp.]|nr:hypothetical protein [Segetibacter sp.]
MKNWRDSTPNECERNFFYKRFPDGRGYGCHCVHSADDCGCDNCKIRHAYLVIPCKTLCKNIFVRLN